MYPIWLTKPIHVIFELNNEIDLGIKKLKAFRKMMICKFLSFGHLFQDYTFDMQSDIPALSIVSNFKWIFSTFLTIYNWFLVVVSSVYLTIYHIHAFTYSLYILFTNKYILSTNVSVEFKSNFLLVTIILILN